MGAPQDFFQGWANSQA